MSKEASMLELSAMCRGGLCVLHIAWLSNPHTHYLYPDYYLYRYVLVQEHCSKWQSEAVPRFTPLKESPRPLGTVLKLDDTITN
jgi:hypothetical protein